LIDKKKIRAILFDSDGVLVDSEALFFNATCEAFASVGISLSCELWARWFLGEGKRSREIAQLLGVPPDSVETTIEKRDKLFWDQIDLGAPVFPGVRETLSRLARDFRLAVVTGSSRYHFGRVHASTGIDGFFELVVTSDDYEQAKPSPSAYLAALRMLALRPDECLAVEDSPRGAVAAVAAGVQCIVVPTRLTDVSLCPGDCLIVKDITHLAALVTREVFPALPIPFQRLGGAVE
jgi:HAD superfamily hydrolase (TIGR01509 family)